MEDISLQQEPRTIDTSVRYGSQSKWMWIIKWVLAIPSINAFLILLSVSQVFWIYSWVSVVLAGRQPRGLFDFLLSINRYMARILAYVNFMTDAYPPISMNEIPEHPVNVKIEYMPRRSRISGLFRPILALPHVVLALVVLAFWIVSFLPFTLFSAFAILITGRQPRPIFDFYVGIIAYFMRVSAYWDFITDEYPPFRFDR